MRITLINPPQFSSAGQVTDGVVPPIGLLYISSVLKQNKFEVDFIDGLGENPFQYYENNGKIYRGLEPGEIVARISPGTKIVGITCMFTIAHSIVMELCGLIKKRFPGALLVLGGAHVSAVPEYMLHNNDVDFVCLGESEFTFLKLCEGLKDAQFKKESLRLDNFGGLGFRSGSKININRNVELLKNVDSLPYPDWDSIPMENYFKLKSGHGALRFDRWAIMLSSRGCPYNCSFCTTPAIWKRQWRPRDPKKVVEEIQYLQARFGVREIHFEDENMNTSVGRLESFCDEIINLGIKINWQTANAIRPHGMSRRIFEKMARAGCTNISLAPESGSKRILDEVIDKSLDPSEILSAARNAVKSNLRAGVYFIMGLPGEKRTDIFRTLRFIIKLSIIGVDECVVSMFAPLPGSRLFDRLRAEGKIEVGEDFFESLVSISDIGKVKSWTEYISEGELKFYQFLGYSFFHVIKLFFHPLKSLRSIQNIFWGTQELKTERFILLKLKKIIDSFKPKHGRPLRAENKEHQQRQKDHFDKIAALYRHHYYDQHSCAYREEFINRPLTNGIELSNKKVLDLMCGNGELSRFLLKKGSLVTGLDISRQQIDFFRNEPGCSYICASIFENGLADNSFDCIFVVSGLHHLHPRINDAVNEIHRILKPGGYFCFCEPHAGSITDFFRKIWYKLDPLVEKNEAAIDLQRLKNDFSSKFDFISQRYIGGPAYLFVLNSMLFRMPKGLKKHLSGFLMKAERISSSLGNKATSFTSISRWQKK